MFTSYLMSSIAVLSLIESSSKTSKTYGKPRETKPEPFWKVPRLDPAFLDRQISHVLTVQSVLSHAEVGVDVNVKDS